MRSVSRRNLFQVLALTAAAGTLAGCATLRVTDENGHTSVILDVRKVASYVTAGTNAANTILSIVQLNGGFSEYTDPLKKILVKFQTAAGIFVEASGGEVSVDYNASNIRSIIDSIVSNIETLATLVKKIVDQMAVNILTFDKDTVQKVDVIYNSLITLVSVIKITLTPGLVHNTFPQHQLLESKVLKTLNA